MDPKCTQKSAHYLSSTDIELKKMCTMQIKIVDYYINIASYDDSRKKDKAVSFAYQHQIECKHTDLQTNLHGFM